MERIALVLGKAHLITFRAAAERHHDRRGKREAWHTWFINHGPRLGAVQSLSEFRLPPGGRLPGSHRKAETVTYVRDGSLTHEDSFGRMSVLRAGEFSRTITGRRVRYSESNASRIHWTQVFQIRLIASPAEQEPDFEQTHFGTARRRGRLCLVASPDGREGSLHLRSEVLIYAAVLDRGLHVIHELPPGQGAWLHVVHGGVKLAETSLTIGDAVGVSDAPAVSFTARERSEILLLRAVV